MRARTPGSDLRRAPQLAGAAFGSGGGLLAECAEALDKLKLSKRPAQQAALESIAYGADLLYVDRTGGGKSLTFQLPAALAWRTAVLAGETLPPILLCVVPYISLGEHQRAAFEALLARMYAAGLLPRLGHVCFVRRAAKGADAPTTAAVAVSPLPGLASATAADTAKSAGGLPAGSRPASLPCGACVGCRGELASNQLGRLPKVKGQPCCWSCRVATTDRDAWCEWCRSSHATGNKVQQQGRGGCAERLRLLGLASSAPATPETAALASRTRNASAAAATSSPAPQKEAAPADVEEPMRLSDLPASAWERLIVEDPNLVCVVVTSAGLTAAGARGRLLREALSLRPRSLTAYDECHTVDDMSMAGYAESLKHVGVVVDSIDAAGGWPRMPRIALTSTLPPVVRQRVMLRLRLAPNARLVRSSINRPDITYFRVPLERREGESIVEGGVQAFALVRRAMPPWVREGRTMIFTTLASTAVLLAKALRDRGERAWSYASRTMTPAQREAASSEWAAEAYGIVVCTGALGTGNSTDKVRLVLAYEFAADPTECFQHLGRLAREDGEQGVAVLCMSARFAVERLALLSPTQRGALACFLRLLAIYCTPDCLRAALLQEFGEGVQACAGCDECCRSVRCADPACGDLLPELAHWVGGRKAACHLLEHVQGLEWQSLTTLLREVPEGAPAPFDEQTAHQMLCLVLLAKGGLVVELRPHPHLERGSIAHVAVSEAVLHSLRFGGESLPVLLPAASPAKRAAAAPASAASSEPVMSEALKSAAVGQEIAALAAGARLQLQRANALLGERVACDGRPLAELDVVPRDFELIKQAVAAPVEGMSTLSAAARATLLRADVLQVEAQLRQLQTQLGEVQAEAELEAQMVAEAELEAQMAACPSPQPLPSRPAPAKRSPGQMEPTPIECSPPGRPPARPGTVRRIESPAKAPSVGTAGDRRLAADEQGQQRAVARQQLAGAQGRRDTPERSANALRASPRSHHGAPSPPSPAASTALTAASTTLPRVALRFDDVLEEDPYEMEMQFAAELVPCEQPPPPDGDALELLL